MVGLLYFGRLEKEKGIDGIIDMIEMYKGKELPFELFIFGSGSRESKIQELASKNTNIHFFGRQSLETIKRYIENCDYCLIPSECLETFGLSALTAIKLGLPPIGYAKGGLKDFISNELDLTHQQGTTTGQKLHHLIKFLVEKKDSVMLDSKLSDSKFGIQNYTKDSRVIRFHALAGKEVKKIIIVSDFINRIGGIETYINDVKELLEQHGYEVELCGGKVPSGTLGKCIKYLGIITGLGNFYEAIKLQRKIKKIQPDLIRYNSVMRYLGRAPMRASKNSTAKKWMMFHDLGYFYPFPSQLTSEHQVKTPFTLKHFLSSYTTKNPLKKLAIIGKYFSLRLIKKQLEKRMDTFLVPSNFMKDIVHKSYNIDNEKIKVFPHFIQE
ncbi:MAG: glycosyltransferase [candidate division SR1 bacterium]|nr:glycosyltransferase [candidate division SR1 bacterium]